MKWFKSETLARSFATHPWIWLLLVMATVVPAAFTAAKLSIQSDFKNLLPANRPSVVTLNEIVRRIGGVGNLAITVEGEDPKAMIRFIDDLVVQLKKLPPKFVRAVEYNANDIRKFYTDNKYLYIELEDLKDIHDRLAKKIRYEKLSQNPFFIALEEDAVDFDVSDIEAKYKGQTSRYDRYIEGYFFDDTGKFAVVMLQPYGVATGTKFAKELMAVVTKVVEDLKPSSYHPSIKVGYTGKYKTVLEEYSQLIKDVLQTLALCLFLVASAIYLYFLRFRAIWLLVSAVSVGVAWTFALTYFQIGFLNSQTAFLGSIIIGNGVNYGIILLARYLEERRKEKTVPDSMHVAISTTWVGTLASAVTTSVAFAVLGISDIKGFSHFGFIGGLGMTLCWAATYVVMPPLLAISERVVPLVHGRKFISKQWESILYPVGSLVAYSPRLIAFAGVLLAAGSLALGIRFLPHSLEYDFSKLENRALPPVPGQKGLGQRVREIFNQNLTPSVILLEKEEQAEFVCQAVMDREAKLPESEKTIDQCKTLRSFLPTQQEEKLKVLAQIRTLLADRSLNFVQPKYRKVIEDFRKEVNVKLLKLENLPDGIRRNFQELDGSLGKMAYVYPRSDAKMSNGKKLMAFVDRMAEIRLPDGSVVRMSGDSAIFSDLLKTVETEGPLTTVLSFLAVFLVIILTFRRTRPIIYVVGGLSLGVLFMIGLQSVLEIKLNFFNFIAYPVTFGIGVDYGVNLLQRYRHEGRGSMRRVLGTVGGAILLCSVTTTISYLTLLPATNQALASFGWLGLFGELACLFAAITVMPAIIHSFDRRHEAPPPDHFEEKRTLPS